MWSTTQKPISRLEIQEHYIGILRQAVEDATEFDIRKPFVYEALDFLQKQSLKSWGFTVFREGLEKSDLALLQQGYNLICQHVGFKNEPT